MKPKEKVLVYACNDAYAKLAGISLLSVVKNTTSRNFAVYIFDDGISDDNRGKLRSIAENNSIDIYFVKIKEARSTLIEKGVHGFINSVDSGWTIYARFFIDRLIPSEIQLVIYLDCDTLVVGDIEDLYNENLNDKPLGMCCDLLRNDYKKAIGFSLDKKYHNSGVLLIDRKKWSECHLEDRLLDELYSERKHYLPDQDVLNIVLSDEIYTLSSRYNWLSSYFLYKYYGQTFVYRLNENNWQSYEDYHNAKDNIVIYHFSGDAFGRPWFSNSKHPVKEEYNMYYRMSPWNDDLQENRTWPLERKVQYFLFKYCPGFISVIIGRAMQRIFILKEYHL